MFGNKISALNPAAQTDRQTNNKYGTIRFNDKGKLILRLQSNISEETFYGRDVLPSFRFQNDQFCFHISKKKMVDTHQRVIS